MKKGVVVENGSVVNIVVLNDDDNQTAFLKENQDLVIVDYDSLIGIGFLYTNGEFIAPPQPEISKEDLILLAASSKNALMAQASEQISILSDAVDFGEATAEDEVLLKEWRLYRIQLNKINPQNAPDIAWPELPV